MSYNTKIVPEGNKFVGYALKFDEVAFITKPCSSAMQASNELQEMIKSQPHFVPTIKTNRATNNSSTLQPTQLAKIRTAAAPPTRRCCGRG